MNKIDADFDQFLCAGRLGSIMLGASRCDVQKAFGVPEHWRGKQEGVTLEEARYWNYGCLSIEFEPNVSLIGFYFNTQWPLPGCVRLTGFVPSLDTEGSELENHLNQKSIRFIRYDPSTTKLDLVLVTGGTRWDSQPSKSFQLRSAPARPPKLVPSAKD